MLMHDNSLPHASPYLIEHRIVLNHIMLYNNLISFYQLRIPPTSFPKRVATVPLRAQYSLTNPNDNWTTQRLQQVCSLL